MLPRPPRIFCTTVVPLELDPVGAAGEPLLETAMGDIPAADEEVEVSVTGGARG
jgi:hypothetical protein